MIILNVLPDRFSPHSMPSSDVLSLVFSTPVTIL